MLEKTTLTELKSKMPRGFLKQVAEKYKLLNGGEISRKTVDRFFNGKSYSTELNKAVLAVIADNEAVVAETKDVLKPAEC